MNNIKKIMEAIEAAGGKSYFVGGFVRDKILGRESKDMDIEVYGLEAAELQSDFRKLEKFIFLLLFIMIKTV
jgi:tRNA nucleotidyltransferase (CCA-adding enzyme)